MASLPTNKKIFNLYKRNSKSFNLSVFDFQFVTSLITRIRQYFRFSFVMAIVSAAITTIRLRRVKIIILKTNLIANMVQTVNLKRVRMTMVVRERLKAVTIIYSKLRIVATTKAIQKTITTLLLRKVVLLLSPIVATFFTLGYYDPAILGDWDTSTLGTMDYTT